MPSMFYLAYGEGQVSTTANGVFLGLAAFAVCCITFVIYSYTTYPADRE